jgi:V/A-type H+/Na+-transporting ATPase subunit G/H
MESSLKRLLEAELQAEQQVNAASQQREQIIAQALQAAQELEHNFRHQLPDLKAAQLEKAKQKATQTIAELHKRYEGRKARLRELSEQQQHKAVSATLALVIDRAMS